jgi:hypothetical protein
MTKFNKGRITAAVRSTITTARTPSGWTHEGAPGFVRDAKGELFLLAVANMVGEATFYEGAAARDSRFADLVSKVVVEDPEWTARFLPWLRTGAAMRSAALVGALTAARAMVDAGMPGSRSVVAAALQRADEPGEALAYWVTAYGRAIPKPVKRGVADAVRRLYTESALLKYDTASRTFRFADVIELTHPAPVAPWQGDLFAWALARRHAREQACPASLATVAANARLRREAAENPRVLLDPQALKAAAMTWEDALSLSGSHESTVDKSGLWSALIPSMGYMALLRNLRNFDEAGVPDDVAERVAARIADPDQVAASRQFPFRFLSAYRAAGKSLRWSHALEKALQASLANVPALTGRTLVLVDLSGSMDWAAAGRQSELTRADVAKVFGAALALRATGPGAEATLVWFDTRSGVVDVPKGSSLLSLVESFPRAGGGTQTGAAVQRWYRRHDRVVIVTDEQAHDTGHANAASPVPEHVPVYTWNLGGYRRGHAPSGHGTRHTFGGLTDLGFQAIPLLEGANSRRGANSGRGGDAGWPF